MTDDHATLLEPACACSLVPIYVPQILRSSLPHLEFPSLSSSLSSTSTSALSSDSVSLETDPGEPTEIPSSAPIIVVIVCGGNAATLERLMEWESKFVGLDGGGISLFDGVSGVDEYLD